MLTLCNSKTDHADFIRVQKNRVACSNLPKWLEVFLSTGNEYAIFCEHVLFRLELRLRIFLAIGIHDITMSWLRVKHCAIIEDLTLIDPDFYTRRS